MSDRASEYPVPMESAPLHRMASTVFSPPASFDVEPQQQEDAISLGATLRRRWRLILAVWLGITVPATAVIWTVLHREYESIGIVRISPVVANILFGRPEDSTALALYSPFLRTQIELMSSPAVLGRALEAPAIRDLDWAKTRPDPIAYLADQLKIENPVNTELVTVSMRGTTRAELAPVVNAVLDAYMEKVAREDQQGDLNRLELLYKKQTDLEEELRVRNDQLYDLAKKWGTLSMGGRQDAAYQQLQDLQNRLEQAHLNRVTIEARLKGLKTQAGSDSPATLQQRKQEYLAKDPELTALVQEKVKAEQALLEALQQMGPRAPRVQGLQKRIDQTKEAITQRQRAVELQASSLSTQAAEADYESDIRKTRAQLEEATQIEAALQEVVLNQTTKANDMGSKNVQLEELRDKVTQIKNLYSEVLRRIQVIETEKQRPARVTIASPARDPLAPTSDRRIKLTLLVLAASLFMAVMAAVFVERGDTSVRCALDVQHHLGVPFLGTRSLLENGRSANPIMLAVGAEEIRIIRGSILFAAASSTCRTLLITSPNPQDGKTRMSKDFARALAQTGRRVLLVDADNRTASLTKRMGFSEGPGLADGLANGIDLASLVLPTPDEGLSFMPCGWPSEHFSEMLVRPGKLERILTFFERYDYVVVDAPPVLLSNEPGVWASRLDGVLLVLRATHSTREDALVTKQRLAQMGGRIIGAILNGVDPRATYYGRYGGRSYGPTPQPHSAETPTNV
jgi:polysaccharide biosynthesis transport protein